MDQKSSKVKPDILSLASKAKSKRREFKLVAEKLKSLKSLQADEMVSRLHDKAFGHINCLECANCCRGLGPRLIRKDIDRLAAHLGIQPSVFTETYLRIDEDGDYVFKSMPCPFLMPDNYCRVYESRPRACREYPHTDQKNIRKILSVCILNTETCPAVYEIFDKLSKSTVNK